MKAYKPIFYYSVMTDNKGDMAIRKSITEAIEEHLKIPFALFNVKYEELTEKRIVNQLNIDGSALMIAGSGLYTNYNLSSGWYFPCKTELFNKIKVPIILIGLGCNNNLGNDIFKGGLSDKAKESIKLINDLAVISTVRDQRTYNILREIGITKHKLMLDPGNFLKVPRIPKEKRIAINLAQHSPTLGRFDGGETGQKERIKNIILFAELGKYVENKGYTVVFIAHDALEQSIIIDLQKYLPRLEYINTNDIDAMLLEYARCAFSIGMKMHSNIMSFAAGTPFLSLYYDEKTPEYLKLLNRFTWGMPVFNDYREWLHKMTNDFILNSNYYSSLCREIKKTEQVKFDKLIGKICNIIQNSI